MKIQALSIFLFASTAVWAQVPASQPPAPAPASAAPSAPAVLGPDTVVATIEGRKLTLDEYRKYVRMLPAQAQQAFAKDPKAFLQQLAFMARLSGEAEKAKIDQKSPYKEQIESSRMQILAQAFVNEKYNSFPVNAADQQKYFDSHKDQYNQVKVKVLYVAFSATPPPAGSSGKKALTEAEAKDKVEKLVTEARGGADFVKLVKANSDDATSVAKDGDFGVIKRTDTIPEPVKTAVFSLKQGQISDPVRQPNGFYIFRAEEITDRPYAEVKDQIFTELKQVKFQEWMAEVRKTLNVTVENQQAIQALTAPAAHQPPSLRTQP